jgi:sugar phosphate isomerase/epimerase
MLTRKEFLRISGFSFLSSTLTAFPHLTSKETLSVGLCGSWDRSTMAKQAGCTYIEAGVANLLMPDKADIEFRNRFDTLNATQPLRVECFNSFLPRELKSVGEHANHEGIIKYASVAFERAEFMGAKIIVFGSSGSRTIPDNFDRTVAKEQFISLCKTLAPLAAKRQILLAIEQLNKEETNFINTLRESAEIVEAVGHPNLKMMCDIYHAMREGDSPGELLRYMDHLVHCHIAEKKERTAPGVMGDDFIPYFTALKKINYSGKVSLECNWKNIEAELPLAVKTLKEQFDRS